MGNGFTIRCENCEKEFIIGSEEYNKNILLYVERDYDRNPIEISCKCGNEMKDI